MTNRTAGYIAATAFAALAVVAYWISLEWRAAHPETPGLSWFTFWSVMTGSFGTAAFNAWYDARRARREATPTPRADAPASYRAQAIDGDGNVQSTGDINMTVSHDGGHNRESWVSASINGWHYEARSPEAVKVSERRGGGLIVTSRGVKVEVWR